MKKNTWLVTSVLLAAVVGSLSAQVFPVRFDDAEEQEVAGMVLNSVRADALILNVLDASPFTCNATNVGVVYLQRDINEAIGGRDHAPCLCAADELDTATYSWRNMAGGQDCETAF